MIYKIIAEPLGEAGNLDDGLTMRLYVYIRSIFTLGHLDQLHNSHTGHDIML